MKLKEFNSKMIYGLFPIIPVLVILFITDSFYTDINNLKRDYQINIKNLEVQKKITIHSIINTRIYQSKMQNNKIIFDLQEKLHESYGKTEIDHKNIQKDINNTRSEKIINLLTEVIINDYELVKLYDSINPDHIVFMSNAYGVIEFNDNRHVKKSNFIRFRSWESVIDTKINTQLASNAIKDILNMNNNTIFWESKYVTRVKPFIRYSSPNNENFNHILSRIDKNEWIYYNILVPSYMYINSSPTDLIIVREINLYKLLEPYIHSINKYDAMVEEYKFDMTRLIFTKIIACISIAIALLISFFFALYSALENIKQKR